MKSNKFPAKSFIKMGVSTLSGYLASRFISNKIGEKFPANKEMMELVSSVAITGAGVYYYPKASNNIKNLVGGAIVGTGLNASVKVLALPQVKSKLPDTVKSLLGGFGTDLDGDSQTISYEDYQNQIEDEVNQRVIQALNAARVNGVEEIGNQDLIEDYSNTISNHLDELAGEEVGTDIEESQIVYGEDEISESNLY
jgi:hypothetical protein